MVYKQFLYLYLQFYYHFSLIDVGFLNISPAFPRQFGPKSCCWQCCCSPYPCCVPKVCSI